MDLPFILMGVFFVIGVVAMFFVGSEQKAVVALLESHGYEVVHIDYRDPHRSGHTALLGDRLQDMRRRTPRFIATNSEGREVQGWVHDGEILAVGPTIAQSKRDEELKQIADERAIRLMDEHPVLADSDGDGELSPEERRAFREMIGKEVEDES